MKKLLYVVAVATLISCQTQSDKSDMQTENPFSQEWDTPYGVPPFEQIKGLFGAFMEILGSLHNAHPCWDPPSAQGDGRTVIQWLQGGHHQENKTGCLSNANVSSCIASSPGVKNLETTACGSCANVSQA